MPSPAEIDYILHKMRVADDITESIQSEWGYSAYFEDSEGNVWELMAQPPIH
ncbi:MAG: hypothetical protein MO846_06195 [Candidatus Devosia symbiotica]|nr:hypothetical protein [Candidatus Devosia symbiotica]